MASLGHEGGGLGRWGRCISSGGHSQGSSHASPSEDSCSEESCSAGTKTEHCRVGALLAWKTDWLRS
jgi:hypothetical protein